MRVFIGAVGSTAVLFLAGCGGGGEGSDSPPPAPVATAAAQHHMAREPLQWDVSGTDSEGIRFRLVLNQTPLDSPAVFPGNGVRGSRKQNQYTLYAQDDIVYTNEAIEYYADGRDLPMGFVNSDGTCDVMSGTRTIPRTAVVGDSGPMQQDNAYSDCARSEWLGIRYVHWSVKRIDSTVFYCQDTTAPGVTGHESFCVQTAPDGTLGARRYYEFKAENGSDRYTLVMKNY